MAHPRLQAIRERHGLLPVEQIFASLFASAGFDPIAIETIRKRTSKNESFEYAISSRKP